MYNYFSKVGIKVRVDREDMKLKQKQSIEKITGKSWDTFDRETIKEYFDYTDKGIRPKNPLNELIISHRQHPITVEMWKEDFKSGLFFLWDFLRPEYPKSYRKHVIEIYESVFGYIPKCYREHPLFVRR